MKMGDTVIYSENGKDYVATVLAVRELDHHTGSNGEPLISLGFFAPVIKYSGTGKPEPVSVIGTQAQHEHAQFRVDVAHVSHSFNKEHPEGKKLHALYPNGFPGGRWEFASVSKSESTSTALTTTEDDSTVLM